MRMNATLLTHMIPYINKRFPPVCNTCTEILSISHILLHCSRFARERVSLATYCRVNAIPFTLDSVLGDGDLVVTDKLIDFLKETRLIRELWFILFFTHMYIPYKLMLFCFGFCIYVFWGIYYTYRSTFIYWSTAGGGNFYIIVYRFCYFVQDIILR